MMYSLLKTSAYLLMLGLIFAKDIPISSNYVVQHTDFCPEVGSYFRREATFNATGPGICYLCFCKNSTSICWLWNGSRCDNQFHHRFGHALSPSGSTRVRRSLTNILKDSKKDYLKKTQQCTPYESSFSDGCPPDDWCLGCTVCDCVAEGKWDCRVLSFCNEGEKETRLQSRRVPLPKNPTKRVYHPNTSTPKNKIAPKPKKVIKKFIAKPQSRKMQYESFKKQHIYKKPTKFSQKSNNNAIKLQNKSKKQKPNKGQPKPQLEKGNTTKKSQKQDVAKKSKEKRTTIKQQPKTIKTPQKQSMRKITNIARNGQVQREKTNMIDRRNTLEETVMGRMILRKVMKQKIQDKKQMEKQQNMTKTQKNMHSKNKRGGSKKKKQKLYDYNSKNSNLRNYTHFRNKREALDISLSIIELNEDNPDLSVKRITKKVTSLEFDDLNMMKDNSTKNSTTAISTTEKISTINQLLVLNSTPADSLYYNYSIDKNSVNSSHFNESAINKDKSNKTSMVHIAERAQNITGQNVEELKQFAVIMSDNAFNDLIYKKWQRMQIFRDTLLKMNEEPSLNEVNGKINDPNLKIRYRNKISRKNKKILDVSNKHSLKTIITNNFKTESSRYLNLTSTNSSNNVSNMQMLLQNLIKELNKSDMTGPTKLRSKFSLFKYLRKIFKKIFSNKKGNNLGHKTNEGMTLQILCENIGACFMNNHNRIALRSKIHDLNAEIENIFKTIKNIKSLLYVIIMPVIKENTTKKLLNDDIQKLDVILKGAFEKSSLTEMQAAQISRVKENIHQFIKSVGRFATLLNEILESLYKNNKTYSCQRNLRLVNKKKKLNSLNKIKSLLAKYNIVQNTFMKKMYILLRNVEKNVTTENPEPRLSDLDLNNTHVIDTYSIKIIENLRKLKNIAQALKSSRKKRQTMREDDAIEYLLVLMEYLLKKNHPLDTAPVNDGIDLLIEAIQNAPDTVYIKPIKKKVLADLPTTRTPTRTTRTTTIDLSYFTEDSISSSNRISKEEINLSKNYNNLAIEVADTEEDTTQIVYYQRNDDYDNTTVHNEYYTTDYANKNTSEKEDKVNTEKTGFDKLDSVIDDNMRRYEVFTSDLEDEAIIPVVINTTEKQVLSTVSKVIIAEESTIATFVPLRDYKLDDDPVVDKKPKLDWIEENFSKEIRAYKDDDISNNTKPTTAHTTTTIKSLDQSPDNISSITVEQEEEKKKKSKVSADEVMYRKQIEFLNSLDYGTDKPDFDDSRKDDEKYSGDSFSSYFVK